MKKNLLRAAVVLILLIIPVTNIFLGRAREPDNQTTAAADISAIQALSSYKVRDVEKKIESIEEKKRERILRQKLLKERAENKNKLIEQIKNGQITFRQLFADTLIVGDSLMNGLEIYDILDSANMITKVGASLYHLADNIGTVINNSPKVLILHYGVNMIESKDYFIDNFINMYTDLIEQIRKGSPETKIVVSGMFPVSSKGIEYEPVLANCPKYEKRIKQMCSELNVTYIDNTGILPDGSDYYDLDGIHVKKAFYTDVWLIHVASELGL